MSYEDFKERINTIISRVSGVSAEFGYDTDKGRFYAKCTDGTIIIGNPSCLKVSVKWGTGHCAIASI